MGMEETLTKGASDGEIDRALALESRRWAVLLERSKITVEDVAGAVDLFMVVAPRERHAVGN